MRQPGQLLGGPLRAARPGTIVAVLEEADELAQPEVDDGSVSWSPAVVVAGKTECAADGADGDTVVCVRWLTNLPASDHAAEVGIFSGLSERPLRQLRRCRARWLIPGSGFASGSEGGSPGRRVRLPRPPRRVPVEQWRPHWRVPVPRCGEGPVGALDNATVIQAACSLREHGFVALVPDAGAQVAPPALLDRCATDGELRLECCLQDIEHAHGKSREEMWRYREVCHRSYRRYDLLLPDDPGTGARGGGYGEADSGGAHAALDRFVDRWAFPVLSAAGYRELVTQLRGQLIAFHGASEQHWHSDGPPEMWNKVNVIVPLVPFSEENGATEFRWQSPDGQSEEVQAACPAGSVLIWNYCVRHRGASNDSHSTRAAAYRTMCPAGSCPPPAADSGAAMLDGYNFTPDFPSCAEPLPEEAGSAGHRLDSSDGLPYAREEFMEHYGVFRGSALWELAAVAPSPGEAAEPTGVEGHT
eukprot:TRINITY_DN5889_c0_g1_i1.p1 TRINITY_DN5889_c0_g1~~TRINITY_DN5889_c0_g1_i1.p1  ORF type:complete len:473 (+),score=106.84 TRINITY_DN5889_c0_g1_i1:83-1501(+)